MGGGKAKKGHLILLGLGTNSVRKGKAKRMRKSGRGGALWFLNVAPCFNLGLSAEKRSLWFLSGYSLQVVHCSLAGVGARSLMLSYPFFYNCLCISHHDIRKEYVKSIYLPLPNHGRSRICRTSLCRAVFWRSIGPSILYCTSLCPLCLCFSSILAILLLISCYPSNPLIKPVLFAFVLLKLLL